ncbi:virulence factor Mce-like protein [Mycolicibacterium sp. BK556]|uniref:MCE family protein n=1 Tax=unclassified Mycolicibacterium TaxID=2636767 RepID=UPI00160B69E2|nr:MULTISPECIES: MCE family protein [unclassified Mycolicibacterium]MBB3603686.1 virulence factor Mce-like protein [Mycolicibacterium sp. BK556]MBB3633881.1 virulence factor Mce-like protein [Mycolicibacterium sp. BK607]
MKSGIARPLAGLATVVVLVAIVALAVGLFQDSFTKTVPVTVISQRAGLVMYPDAKVKLNGAPVGKVSSIELLPDGQAALHLALNPDRVNDIPANVSADITSSTVFGSKFVELNPPQDASAKSIQSGQVIEGKHVTVEINTVFQQLVTVLSQIEPAKLNQTLGAIAKSLDGRGDKFGQTLVDLDSALTKLNPSLDTINHELQVAPKVFDAYGDVSGDLVTTVKNASKLSDTIVDQDQNLDTLLVSAIGLADVGTEVLSQNKDPLANVVHLLVPTTDLLNKYSPALNCGIGGLVPLATGPGLPLPGAVLLQSFFLGRERYRYPANLPKVAASGGPQCTDMPKVPFETSPPFVVSDIGANPAQYGNQGILLNSDGLKQALFGPLDGPPRNTAQIGQPG